MVNTSVPITTMFHTLSVVDTVLSNVVQAATHSMHACLKIPTQDAEDK